MTIPTLPAQGSTSWYSWASGIDTAARPAVTVAPSGDATGVTDLANINAALTALGGNPGRVQLLAGTFTVSGAITIPSDGVAIAGVGETATVVNCTSTTQHGITASGHRNITIRDLKLSGAGSGSVDGIYLAGPSAYAVFDVVLRNVFITGFGRHGVHTEDLCGSVLDHVRTESCGADGFHISDDGSSGLGGTSNTFLSCYANACGQYGYYLDAVTYSTLVACSSDSCTTAYFVNRSTTLTFASCGAESTAAPGYGFALYNGTTSVVLTGCYALNINASGAGFRVGANGGSNSSRITLIGCRVLGTTVPAFSLQVDSANQATVIGFQKHPSAANATTGTVSYVSDENTGDTTLPGNLTMGTVGKGLQVKAGTNGRIGTASLASGTVTIANSSVTANTTVLAMAYNIVGTPGFLAMSGRTAGTSFTITSYTGAGAVNTADSSSFTWLLVERA